MSNNTAAAIATLILVLAPLGCLETKGRILGSPDPDTSTAVCVYGGETYQQGDSFIALDGCNSCTCEENGAVACNEEGCTLCYGPGEILENVLEPSSVGCPCENEGEELCAGLFYEDGRELLVSLVCSNGHWLSTEEGECERDYPDPGCYGPDQFLDIAFVPGAVGCRCDIEGADVCASYLQRGQTVRVSLGCINGMWIATEDGECERMYPDPSCYGPDQNLEIADEPGNIGCPCEVEAQEVCARSIQDGILHSVSLYCFHGRWSSVEEGACYSGTSSPDCYSPHHNLETAYEPGSTGCSCDPEGADLCVPNIRDDGSIHLVTLSCLHGSWISGEDGECDRHYPEAPGCYAPDRNLEVAYEPGSVGCPCNAEGLELCAPHIEADGSLHLVTLSCMEGRWISGEDGACDRGVSDPG